MDHDLHQAALIFLRQLLPVTADRLAGHVREVEGALEHRSELVVAALVAEFVGVLHDPDQRGVQLADDFRGGAAALHGCDLDRGRSALLGDRSAAARQRALIDPQTLDAESRVAMLIAPVIQPIVFLFSPLSWAAQRVVRLTLSICGLKLRPDESFFSQTEILSEG